MRHAVPVAMEVIPPTMLSGLPGGSGAAKGHSSGALGTTTPIGNARRRRGAGAGGIQEKGGGGSKEALAGRARFHFAILLAEGE